jgi:nitronate monooxygenase
MWRDTRLLDLLGIDHPILQAPMAGSATPEMAAAVGAMGGLGSLGCSQGDPELVRGYAKAMRALTNAPFNLNFFVTPPQTALTDDEYARLRDAMAPFYNQSGLGPVPPNPAAPPASFTSDTVDLLLDLRPPVVSFHFGLPEPQAIAALKAAGIVLLASATNVAEARQIRNAGIDAVIAQGWEAGGHRGSFMPGGPGDGVGLMSLVPQIADAVDIPVIAAGGIADARGIVAALALGAAGVQIGTAFLRSPESAAPEAHKAAIAETPAEATMFTNAASGRAARGMTSDYARYMADIPGPYPPFPSMYALSRPLIDHHKTTTPGKASFYLFGQSASLARAEPAREIMQRLLDDTAKLFQSIGPAS